MIWHSNSLEDVIGELKSDPKAGLTSHEASLRLQKINTKIENKKEKNTLLKYILAEIRQPVFYFIFAAIIISLIFHWIFDVFTAFDIIAVLIMALLKAILGGFANHRYAIEINKSQETERTTFSVLRDGVVVEISSDLLVPGDIIRVGEGDYIPADARLLAQNDLHCDEFSVTGETVPAPKDALAILPEISAISQRDNMIFAGSYVVSGTGVAIVTEITDYTEYGKNQKIQTDTDEYTLSIEQRLLQLTKLINTGATVVFAVLFVISLIITTINSLYDFSFIYGLASSLLLVGGLAISFIPSSVSLIATAAVSRGIRRMSKKGISIYDSKTVDTISKLDVICADKTGTFTQNKMLLTQIFNGTDTLNVATDVFNAEYKMLLRLAALCCDGDVKYVKGVSVQSGDSTQTAIIAASMEHLGLSKYDLDNIYPRMYEFPFDPERKLMTTVNVIDGKKYVIVRGQPEALSLKCQGSCDVFLKTSEEMSARNLRVVGVATKVLNDDEISLTPDDLETNLNFVGLLGLSDIPRLDSKPSVIDCQKAGMKVVMITGDHKSAAFITASKLNIVSDENQILTGEEIDAIDDDKLCEIIDNYTVFALVDSNHRIRIIEAFKNNGHTVAITGDTASNTSSLRSADVGYSMGATGSDVAICTSEVIIDDDSFSTVVDSVRDCRGIYGCISKSLKFFFSSALGIVVSLVLGLLIFGTQILTTPEIILLAVGAISAMALGLVYEPAEHKDLELIIDNDFEIFKISFLFDVIFQAIIYTLTALVSYSLAGIYGVSPSTFTFLTLCLMFVLSAFISRTKKQLINFTNSNKHILVLAGITVLVTAILIICGIGKLATIGFVYWIFSLLTAIVSNLVLLAIKFIRR